MNARSMPLLVLAGMVVLSPPAAALDRPDITFKVFQFPADQIPRIDAKTDDWAIVPDSYVIGIDQMVDDEGGHTQPDRNDMDAKVKVGWVKGLNRLYFLYEATDDFLDISRPDLHNDMFEVVVDGDASGGPLIDAVHRDVWTQLAVGAMSERDRRLTNNEIHWANHGVHAQNYHIFTPAKDKDWCMAWGSNTWIKELPWANAKCVYEGEAGQRGKVTLEFWITPFDYAGPEGPQRAVESVLSENKIIGMSWAIIDYDDPTTEKRDFWNLSRHHTMFGNASQLCAFRLMPMEPELLPKLEARWSFKLIDPERRIVAFKDESVGNVTSWKWDFGDGQTSTEKNPIYEYAQPRTNYVVILEVQGPDGTSRRSKVWDVQMK